MRDKVPRGWISWTLIFSTLILCLADVGNSLVLSDHSNTSIIAIDNQVNGLEDNRSDRLLTHQELLPPICSHYSVGNLGRMIETEALLTDFKVFSSIGLNYYTNSTSSSLSAGKGLVLNCPI